VWILGVIVGAELWFHEGKPIQSTWSISPPEGSTAVEISKWTADLLMADESLARKWTDPEENQWQLYFFRWKAGPVRSRLLAQLHRPEICLPATGLLLNERRVPIAVSIEGVRREFNAYTFTHDGLPTFVYWGAWEDRSARAIQNGNLSESLPVAAFQTVMWRERHLGQEVLELAVSGCADANEADGALRRLIPLLIIREER
jgi:hypothetical protein